MSGIKYFPQTRCALESRKGEKNYIYIGLAVFGVFKPNVFLIPRSSFEFLSRCTNVPNPYEGLSPKRLTEVSRESKRVLLFDPYQRSELSRTLSFFQRQPLTS